jgi:hypothetical protein
MAAGNQNERDLQQWMEDIAKQQQPKKKLIFDKKLKRLIAVAPNDPRVNPRVANPDDALEFTSEEAKRFIH